jgi:CBS domain-containing protein
MYVKEILRLKGHDVHTISSNVTLAEVVDELVDCRCGSLVVVDDGVMVGIVTERDILRACALQHARLAETRLGDVMEQNLITASLTDKVSEIMGVMTNQRIRHLPITEDGNLVGIVSIGDVVKAQHAELRTENQSLKEYIIS